MRQNTNTSKQWKEPKTTEKEKLVGDVLRLITSVTAYKELNVDMFGKK